MLRSTILASRKTRSHLCPPQGGRAHQRASVKISRQWPVHCRGCESAPRSLGSRWPSLRCSTCMRHAPCGWRRGGVHANILWHKRRVVWSYPEISGHSASAAFAPDDVRNRRTRRGIGWNLAAVCAAAFMLSIVPSVATAEPITFMFRISEVAGCVDYTSCESIPGTFPLRMTVSREPVFDSEGFQTYGPPTFSAIPLALPPIPIDATPLPSFTFLRERF